MAVSSDSRKWNPNRGRRQVTSLEKESSINGALRSPLNGHIDSLRWSISVEIVNSRVLIRRTMGAVTRLVDTPESVIFIQTDRRLRGRVTDRSATFQSGRRESVKKRRFEAAGATVHRLPL